ncbi:MAG TPA: FG-GAP-like repeat-containing protein [Bryobacteraceae bacterium]|nr:FG-GAP-like repeat-containing protein [Bryobacteraceae bacterium]
MCPISRWCFLASAAIALMAPNADSQTLSFGVTSIPVDQGPGAIATADFNGDGIPDLAVLHVFPTNSITVLLGKGDGTFSAPKKTPTIKAFGSTSGLGSMVAADFNHDGKADIALVSGFGGGGGDLLVHFGRGDGTFDSPVTYAGAAAGAVGMGNVRMRVADLNGDGNLDLIAGGQVLLGRNDGTFSNPIPMLMGPGQIFDYDIGDFNGDGKLDLVLNVNNAGVFTTYIALGKGDASFATPTPIAIPQSPSCLVVAGDFNGDGKLDFACLNRVAGPALGLLGNGDGTFGPPARTTNAYFSATIAADIDGDGKADLIQNGGTPGVVVFLSKGDGSFQASGAFGAAGNLVAADFNGDGKVDLATADASAAIANILLNTTKIFNVRAVLNGASFATNQAVSAGSLVSLFGFGFASSNAQASTIPLPTSLGGVSVTFNGIQAPLLFVSATQINAQVPWPLSGNVNVVVTANNSSTTPFQLSIAAAAPGVFATSSGQAIAINADGSLAGPANSIPGLATRPAVVGDPLIILATGMGAVTPAIDTGAASSDTLRYTVATPTVLIGGVPAQLLFSGLSPQFVGVNQLNVVVPAVSAGIVPLQIQAGSITSTNKVTIAVKNP